MRPELSPGTNHSNHTRNIMKKKTSSKSAFFTARALFGFGIFSMALFLALFALARQDVPVQSIAARQDLQAPSVAVGNLMESAVSDEELAAIALQTATREA